MRRSGTIPALAIAALLGTGACGGGGDATNGATADTTAGAPSGAAAPAMDTTGAGASGTMPAAPMPGDTATGAMPATGTDTTGVSSTPSGGVGNGAATTP